jgi:hypothetical protein
MTCFRRYIFHVRAVIAILLIVGLTPKSGRAANTDVTGTWSGTFNSKYPGVPPFTFTTVISLDSHGKLHGTTHLKSRCIKDVLKAIDLLVTVNGSNVSLAGSTQNGVTVTLQGTTDQSGKMNIRYTINGSAIGLCESDNGTGTLTRSPK